MGGAGRTGFKGKPSSKKKYQRDAFTYAYKYDVLLDYLDGCSHGELQARYPRLASKPIKSVRGLVSKWMKKLELITRMAGNTRTSGHQRQRARGVGTTLTPASESIIVTWINELRLDGIPVSSLMLGLKAEEVAAEQGVPDGVFTATNTWKGSFLQRHKLSFRAKNRAGQASPDADASISRAFAIEVRAWMAEHHTGRVYNADQTGVNFEMLPKTTVNERGASTVWVRCGKKEKQRATDMFLADSDGNKYEPWVITKTEDSTVPGMQAENNALRHGFGKTLWPIVQDIQKATGLQLYGNPTAWWNEDLTVAWLEFFFGDRTATSEPVLLLLDSFSGHWTTSVRACAERLYVQLKSVPPRLTWRCQPADVAWMKPFKDGLRSSWVQFLREQLSRRTDVRKTGKKFVMTPPDRGDVCEWIADVWGRLSERIIVSGFVKCGFRDRVHPEPEAAPNDTIQPEPNDTTELIAQLERVGFIDRGVGFVSESMDVVSEAIANAEE